MEPVFKPKFVTPFGVRDTPFGIGEMLIGVRLVMLEVLDIPETSGRLDILERLEKMFIPGIHKVPGDVPPLNPEATFFPVVLMMLLVTFDLAFGGLLPVFTLCDLDFPASMFCDMPVPIAVPIQRLVELFEMFGL